MGRPKAFYYSLKIYYKFISVNLYVGAKEKLEKALEKGITDESVKKRVTDLVNSIDENDNNYVLFGKLK